MLRDTDQLEDILGVPGTLTRACNGGAFADSEDELEEIDVYEKVEDDLHAVEKFLKMTAHKNIYENIENRCWTEINDWWSLGG